MNIHLEDMMYLYNVFEYFQASPHSQVSHKTSDSVSDQEDSDQDS
jgi:hypothetical protein